LAGVSDLLIRVEYTGDVGNAYVAGRLAHDNFANGVPWDISLARIDTRVFTEGLVFDIIPVKKGAKVIQEAMAGRSEQAEDLVGELGSIRAVPIRQVRIV
jgi:hypothetical protein